MSKLLNQWEDYSLLHLDSYQLCYNESQYLTGHQAYTLKEEISVNLHTFFEVTVW